MRLTEVLRSKERTAEQQFLVDRINMFQYDTKETHVALDDILDYSSPEIKKRAMSIGIAFNIAFKFMLSMLYSGLDIKETLRSSIFFRAEKKIKEGALYLETQNVNGDTLLFSTISNVAALTFEDENFFQKLASFSITLGWFKAFEESGYFPKDLTVLDIASSVHLAMTKEVEALLEKAYKDFVYPFVLDSHEHFIVIEPVIITNEAYYQPDFIFDTVMYDIHTTADPKSISKNIKNLIGAYILNQKEEKQNIKGFATYYPRLNLIEECFEYTQSLFE